jgi:hypothetical protein
MSSLLEAIGYAVGSLLLVNPTGGVDRKPVIDETRSTRPDALDQIYPTQDRALAVARLRADQTGGQVCVSGEKEGWRARDC